MVWNVGGIVAGIMVVIVVCVIPRPHPLLRNSFRTTLFVPLVVLTAKGYRCVIEALICLRRHSFLQEMNDKFIEGGCRVEMEVR